MDCWSQYCSLRSHYNTDIEVKLTSQTTMASINLLWTVSIFLIKKYVFNEKSVATMYAILLNLMFSKTSVRNVLNKFEYWAAWLKCCRPYIPKSLLLSNFWHFNVYQELMNQDQACLYYFNEFLMVIPNTVMNFQNVDIF